METKKITNLQISLRIHDSKRMLRSGVNPGMMKTILIVIILFFATMTQATNWFNIKDYGAKGDGKTIDTQAINKAIDKASNAGGGTVFFPAGTYLSYSIELKNNITLRLDAGAILKAASPEGDVGYDAPEANDFSQYQDFGHSHWKNSLIWGIGLHDITICGEGMIDGTGLERKDFPPAYGGDKAISLKLCRNVVLKDIRMLRCGHFALLATGVDNMTIDKVLIDTNRDGMDVDACRNVRISNCTVNSPFDDAIVLKATYSLGFFRNTENVTISNCYVSGYNLGTVMDGTFQPYKPTPGSYAPTGRIKLGTESSGGFSNIAISNCVFDHCYGLALETVDGGDLENVTVSNIVMRDMYSSPIFLRLGARMRSPQGTPIGRLHRISIDNVRVYNANSNYVCLFSGLPDHPIEDVKLDNISIYYQGGGTQQQANLVVPEKEKAYPEPTMFGELPAAAFYIRHANNLQMNNIDVYFTNPDARPAVVMQDVHGIAWNNLIVHKGATSPYFSMKNVTDFQTFHCRDIQDTTIQHAAERIY
jgi:polygalacturonase